MNRVSALAAIFPKTCVRRLSVTQIRCVKSGLDKIKKKQLHFQADNDIPIYLKGGPMDYVLYYTTVALIFIGVSASVHSTYKLTSRNVAK